MRQMKFFKKQRVIYELTQSMLEKVANVYMNEFSSNNKKNFFDLIENARILPECFSSKSGVRYVVTPSGRVFSLLTKTYRYGRSIYNEPGIYISFPQKYKSFVTLKQLFANTFGLSFLESNLEVIKQEFQKQNFKWNIDIINKLKLGINVKPLIVDKTLYDQYFITSAGLIFRVVELKPAYKAGNYVVTIRDTSGSHHHIPIAKLVYCMYNRIDLKSKISISFRDKNIQNYNLDNIIVNSINKPNSRSRKIETVTKIVPKTKMLEDTHTQNLILKKDFVSSIISNSYRIVEYENSLLLITDHGRIVKLSECKKFQNNNGLEVINLNGNEIFLHSFNYYTNFELINSKKSSNNTDDLIYGLEDNSSETEDTHKMNNDSKVENLENLVDLTKLTSKSSTLDNQVFRESKITQFLINLLKSIVQLFESKK